MKYYTLDEETHELLEAALLMASHVADCQRRPEDADSIYGLLHRLAERFGIDTDPFESEPEPPQDNVAPLNTVPRFRVIDNPDYAE